MDLTGRTVKATLRSLPNEIIGEILSLFPRSDLVTICLVSQLFNTLGSNTLYREIALVSRTQATQCCTTLVANKSKAAAVRTLRVLGFVVHGDSLESFSKLLKTAITSLLQIQCLDFLRCKSITFSDYGAIIRQCTLPQLQSFMPMRLPYATDTSISFLNRHTNLVEIYIPMSSEVPLSSIELPRLRIFTGPQIYIPLISGKSQLREVTIAWSSKDSQDVGSAITALASSSKHSLTQLRCIRDGHNADLVEFISRKIPNITYLSVRSLAQKRASDGALRSITLSLSNFVMLTRLDYGSYLKPISLEDDLAIVKRWGAACSSSTQINLYVGAWVLSDSVWLRPCIC